MTYAHPQLEKEIAELVSIWRSLIRDPQATSVPPATGIAVEFAFERAVRAEGLPYARLEAPEQAIEPGACVWVSPRVPVSDEIANRLATAKCVAAEHTWEPALANAGAPSFILSRPQRSFRP